MHTLKYGTLNLLLLIAGAVIFTLAFPNPVVRAGVAPLAFFSLLPVVVLIRRIGLAWSPLYGFFYGLFTYALFNSWLANFHPLAIFIVPLIYASYFFVLFPLLKIVDLALPERFRFLGQTILWMGYEYFRIRFYLGYAYGILGYTQYSVPPMIQIAEIFGVWGVSFLVILPSFYLGQKLVADRSTWKGVGNWAGGLVYLILFFGVLAYGFFSPIDYSDTRMWKVALVQQNIDPWIGGFRAYRRSLDALIRQSDAAIENVSPEIVIWSETSFVPSIDFHTRYREDQERFELVKELLDYLADQSIPFVVGNDDGRLIRSENGELERIDYNAVLVYDRGRILDTYRKIHLVPFTEHFPYKSQLPGLHQLLVENDTHFWEKGTEYTVFEAAGVRFSTPICFEDTFGYLSRGFVRNGAEVIVNMTNDLWSFSESAAMQHMGMAVFRAVENRRSVVRSTNGGMTTIIDPNGVILDIYPPFIEGYLAGEVPVFTGKETLYTRWGDWFAWLMVALSGFVFFYSVTVLVWKRTSQRLD